MTERLVSYAGIKVLLTTDNAGLDSFMVPPITAFAELSDGEEQATVHHTTSDNFGITRQGDHSIEVEGPAALLGSVFYLGELAAESYRQKVYGGAMIHAAAIANEPDSGVLILGEKGGGKTTATIRACVEGGSLLIGNDQVILGCKGDKDLRIVDGSKDLTVRQSATMADKWLGDIISTDWPSDTPHWDNKIRFRPQELGITVAQKSYALKAVVKLCIDRTQMSTSVVKKPQIDMQSTLFLAERFSRLVRGTTTPIITDDNVFLGYAPNMDSEQAAKNRLSYIAKMFDETVGFQNVYAHDSGGALHVLRRLLK